MKAIFPVALALLFCGCAHDYTPAVKKATEQIVAIKLADPNAKRRKVSESEKVERLKKAVPLWEQISVSDCPKDYQLAWRDLLQALRDYLAVLEKESDRKSNNAKRLLVGAVGAHYTGPLALLQELPGLQLKGEDVHPVEQRLIQATDRFVATAEKYLTSMAHK